MPASKGTNLVTVKTWNEKRFGPLTLEKLREQLVDKHIVRPGKYECEYRRFKRRRSKIILLN
jgi:hypothetical protein